MIDVIQIKNAIKNNLLKASFFHEILNKRMEMNNSIFEITVIERV